MTRPVPALRVIAEPSRQRALAAWREGLDSEDVLALLDPGWPAAIRDAAERLAGEALASGRLAPRDLVVFTSGSSGVPRAIHRTRRSWETSGCPFADLLGLGSGDTGEVVAIPGPLASTLFAFGAWHAGFSGCEAAAAAVDELPAHPRARDLAVVHAVPAMLPTLLAHRERGSLPALRVLVVAGDALGAESLGRATALGLRVVEYYGAAELSFVGIRDAYADPDGPMRPFPGVEVEVRDGVLWSRSPYRMSGYLGPAGPMRLDADGWATVGDLASGDGSGFVVRGRGDAAVITGGHTVVVEEVERFLRSLPRVTDAGVSGVPHARLGQRVVAVVDGSLDTDELRAACRRLPDWSRPRAFVHGRVPRAHTGKILRGELRDVAAAVSTKVGVP